MGKTARGRSRRWSIPTQSTHKLLAGISQASQVLVQDAQNAKLDRHLFNEAFLMHTSTSRSTRSSRRATSPAAMMEPPGGTALVEEIDRRSAGLPPRDAQGRQGVRPTGGSRSGAGPARRRGHRQVRRLDDQGRRQVARLRRARGRLSTCSTRSSRPSSRRGWTCRAIRRRSASRRRSSPSTSPSTG